MLCWNLAGKRLLPLSDLRLACLQESPRYPSVARNCGAGGENEEKSCQQACQPAPPTVYRRAIRDGFVAVMGQERAILPMLYAVFYCSVGSGGVGVESIYSFNHCTYYFDGGVQPFRIAGSL